MYAFNDLILAIQNSDLGTIIREDDTLFPLIESVHVLAITLVVGSISVVDLRLLGLASKNRAVGRVTASILPITWVAFAIAVATGSLLFASHASKYLQNGFFVAKLALIAAAGVNMVIFHFVGAKEMNQFEKDASPPFAAIAECFSGDIAAKPRRCLARGRSNSITRSLAKGDHAVSAGRPGEPPNARPPRFYPLCGCRQSNGYFILNISIT